MCTRTCQLTIISPKFLNKERPLNVRYLLKAGGAAGVLCSRSLTFCVRLVTSVSFDSYSSCKTKARKDMSFLFRNVHTHTQEQIFRSSFIFPDSSQNLFPFLWCHSDGEGTQEGFFVRFEHFQPTHGGRMCLPKKTPSVLKLGDFPLGGTLLCTLQTAWIVIDIRATEMRTKVKKRDVSYKFVKLATSNWKSNNEYS